jgi:hypothetical protein
MLSPHFLHMRLVSETTITLTGATIALIWWLSNAPGGGAWHIDIHLHPYIYVSWRSMFGCLTPICRHTMFNVCLHMGLRDGGKEEWTLWWMLCLSDMLAMVDSWYVWNKQVLWKGNVALFKMFYVVLSDGEDDIIMEFHPYRVGGGGCMATLTLDTLVAARGIRYKNKRVRQMRTPRLVGSEQWHQWKWQEL